MKTEEQYFDRADVIEFWAFRDYLRKSNLSTSARLLAVDVWFHMRIGKLRANPSVATLVENTGMSERTVKRGLADLKSCGFFKMTGGRGKRQTYKFEMVAPQKTLFELSEMLSEREKSTPRKGVKSAPYDAGKGANLSGKGANLAPEYNLEYKTTTISAREVSKIDFSECSLRSRLIDAAGCAIVNPAQCSDLANTRKPREWLDAGCDLEADILPTVRLLSARKPAASIRTWDYFNDAVIAAKTDRQRPPVLPASGDNLNPVRPGSIRYWQAKAWAALEELDQKDRERGSMREAACA